MIKPPPLQWWRAPGALGPLDARMPEVEVLAGAALPWLGDVVEARFLRVGSTRLTTYAVPSLQAPRPVVVAFNGGPGAGSAMINLGLLGPRAATPDGLADNPLSVLRVADLVVIDLPGTGFAPEPDPRDDQPASLADALATALAIRSWQQCSGRQADPLVVVGQSYGTVRAVLAGHYLAEVVGAQLAGLVLISTTLHYGRDDFLVDADRAAVNFLPSYAAAAWAHGRRDGAEIAALCDHALAVALDGLAPLLVKGARATPTARRAMIGEVSRLSGLAPVVVERHDLRVPNRRYCVELLRDRGLAIGRGDVRATAPLDPVAAQLEDDHSFAQVQTVIASAATQHLTHELGVAGLGEYVAFNGARYRRWSYADWPGVPVNVLPQLGHLLRTGVPVQVHAGRFDLATPYAAAVDNLAHLGSDHAPGRVEQLLWDGGHAPYLDAAVHDPMAAAIGRFVADSTRGADSTR